MEQTASQGLGQKHVQLIPWTVVVYVTEGTNTRACGLLSVRAFK